MTGLERLKVLIDWFEDDANVKPHQVELAIWCKERTSCGTVGCAVGHAAASCAALQAEGLALSRDFPNKWTALRPVYVSPSTGDVYTDWDAVVEFFELGDPDMRKLHAYTLSTRTPFAVVYPGYADVLDTAEGITKSAVCRELRKFYDRLAAGEPVISRDDWDEMFAKATKALADLMEDA